MKHLTLRRLGVACFLLTLTSACTTAVPEPPGGKEELAIQTYSFETIWECLLEAVEKEGYEIDINSREGDKGTFLTRYKVVKANKITGQQEARRIWVQMNPTGATKSFKVRVAASIFERDDPQCDWSYQGSDQALLSRLKQGYAASLKKRYQPEDSP